MAARKGGAKYRKLYQEFYTDDKIQCLAREEKVDEIAVIKYSILGIMACRDRNITGIYKIHRQDYKTFVGLNLERTTAALTYLTKNMPSLLEYDFVNHVISVKGFFDQQTDYKPGISALEDIMDGFKETFHLAPRFWVEFVERYRKQLGKIYIKLASCELLPAEKKERADFLDRLFELKNEINQPSVNFVSTSAEKFLDSEKILSL